MQKMLLSLFVLVGISGVIASIVYKPSDTFGSSTTTSVATTKKITITPTPTSLTTSAKTSVPTATPILQTTPSYSDGKFSALSNNRYGTVAIKVTISGGRIAAVDLTTMPSDHRESQEISDFSGPRLVKETINAQSADIDFVTGATFTSQSYVQALQDALNQATG